MEKLLISIKECQQSILVVMINDVIIVMTYIYNSNIYFEKEHFIHAYLVEIDINLNGLIVKESCTIKSW